VGAVSSAVLLAAAAPPSRLWFVALFALVPLLLSIRGLGPWRSAALTGCTSFLAILLVTGWWVPLLREFAGLSVPQALLVTGVVCAKRKNAQVVEVGLVQPNFGPFSPQGRERYGQRYLALLREETRKLAADGAELVVCPECAWPFLFDRSRQREFPPGHPWDI